MFPLVLGCGCSKYIHFIYNYPQTPVSIVCKDQIGSIHYLNPHLNKQILLSQEERLFLQACCTCSWVKRKAYNNSRHMVSVYRAQISCKQNHTRAHIKIQYLWSI